MIPRRWGISGDADSKSTSDLEPLRIILVRPHNLHIYRGFGGYACLGHPYGHRYIMVI